MHTKPWKLELGVIVESDNKAARDLVLKRNRDDCNISTELEQIMFVFWTNKCRECTCPALARLWSTFHPCPTLVLLHLRRNKSLMVPFFVYR